MPMYLDFSRACTTNGTTQTLTTHFRMLTVASQNMARIAQLYAAPRGSAAGGGSIRITTAATAGTGGSAVTLSKADPVTYAGTPATTVFADTSAGGSAITAGGTPSIRRYVGFAQTGGQGGWVAGEQDDCIALASGGGANGNAEIGSMAIGTSQLVDVTCVFFEG